MVIFTVKTTSAFISKKAALAQDRLHPPQFDVCGALNPTVVPVPVKSGVTSRALCSSPAALSTRSAHLPLNEQHT